MIRQGLLFLSNSDQARKVLTGTPVTRALSRRFVPGETVDDVIEATREANAKGLAVTANYLGEAVRSEADAVAAADQYIALLQRIREESLEANASLKFTQMGQDISEPFLARNLGRVLETAREGKIFLRFDMESSAYTERTLGAFEALWTEGWRDIGVVLQAYLKRTPGDVRRMIELGARVRLCKGAYAEPASVAFQDPLRIREAFLESMRWLMAEGVFPGLATHDDILIDAAREFASREGISKDRFEFQMLYGVRRALQEELVAEGYRVRVYVPYGEKWYPYLMRRMAERPENLFLVAGSVVRESPLGFLWGGGKRK
jgi:proline dehydrogenase